jgi:uncharacterized protein (TIGR02145 family)
MLDPAYNEAEMHAKHVGLTVYNIEGNACPPIPSGIYVWDGSAWKPLVEPEPNLMTDCRDGETYYIGDFGTAGIWMLENLRYIPAVADGYSGYAHDGTTASNVITDKYYAFPGPNTSSYQNTDATKNDWLTNRKHMGVLYNWPGATNEENTLTVDQGNKNYLGDGHPKVRGVCPEDWHLPSDMEWSDLEEVIQTAPAGTYSPEAASGMTSGFRTNPAYRNAPLGTKMKSTTEVNNQPTNGASFSAATGGFDALLVGIVLNGSRSGFGTNTHFWSSSCGGGSYSIYRSLDHDVPTVRRDGNYRSNRWSVRCKKD